MADEPEPKPLFDTAFEPYASAIGYLVREWNYLQNKFCDLFCTIMEPTSYEVSSAVWYAVQNDRMQRALLLAAATIRLSAHTKCLEDIEWIIGKANGLGSQRDDTIHSPMRMLIGDPIQFISMYFYGHPRAMNLKGKNLLEEFELYRKNAAILRNYLSGLESHIRLLLRGAPAEMQTPLPEKPQLLTSPKRTLRKAPSPKSVQSKRPN